MIYARKVKKVKEKIDNDPEHKESSCKQKDFL